VARRTLFAVRLMATTILGAAIAYTLGIRSRSPTVRRIARRFHHVVGNPLQMRAAGRPGGRASVLRHTGRVTGREYETPVWAARTEDGFVIGIVYGARTDWLENIMASGSAAITFDGRTYRVDRPEIVPMDGVRAYFPGAIRRLQRPVGVDRCLRVRRARVSDTSEKSEEGSMVQQSEDRVIPYPKSRRFMEEAIRSTHNKPMMHGLLEVDVTDARTYIREEKARTGESPSFTGFVIGCLGRAVEEHPEVHALRDGNHRLVLFGDVDVLTWIERDIAGQPQVVPGIVRAANRKTFRQIHDEIRIAQTRDVRTIDVGGAKASQLLPAWLFRPYFSFIVRLGKWFPREWKKRWGTVTISAVGIAGAGAGWGIPPSSPSICWITVGGIGRKRDADDGDDSAREYLSLTVSFDHRMIDGAPAARFTERLKELIETAYGLDAGEASIVEPTTAELSVPGAHVNGERAAHR